MKKLIQSIAAATVIAGFSGCSTIVFTNGAEPDVSARTYDMWHHNLALSLYEYSEPVAPDAYCDTGWGTVTVEKDLIRGFVGSLDNAIIPFVDIWDPWAVFINCTK